MSRYLTMSRIMRSNKDGCGGSSLSMSRPRAALIGVVSAVGAIIVTLSVALAQLTTGDGSTFRGKVVDDFGNKFVIETDAGKFLVEPRGPTADSVRVNPAETLIVTGVVQQRVIDASRIVRENGEIVFALSTSVAPLVQPPESPPGGSVVGRWAAPEITSAQIQAVLKAQGLTQVGVAERKKRHIEVRTRDGNGRDVIASLDLFGRIWEIEDADHDNKRVPVQITADTQAASITRQAGYGEPRSIERRKHHFEVLTTNSSGEYLEVHVDLSGHIYKRVWVR